MSIERDHGKPSLEGVSNGLGSSKVGTESCLIVPQSAVRMGFLLAAKELGRTRRARPGKPPGARFGSRHKNIVNVMLCVVPERKNK